MLIWMKSAYASKLATHFLIQTSAWLNCNENPYDTVMTADFADSE